MLLEERQHPIIQQIGRRDRYFPVIQFGKAHFAIGIDEGLLIDAADALERADVEGVLPVGLRSGRDPPARPSPPAP